MAFLTLDQLAFVFGLLGNIVSFMVFLAPVPTFYKIYKKKSSEGFQSIPYVVALSSAMLLLYYGFVKAHAYMIITINGIGCAIEIIYLSIYITYASKEKRIATIKMILIFNIGVFGLMLALVNSVVPQSKRINAVGLICAAYNLAVFAAPLSIMKQVIRTKSVEYMPFLLSFFLTLCATMWFFYGLFIKDYFIGLPNVLGFMFGVAQMILYMVYKESSNKNGDTKLREKNQTVSTSMVSIKNIVDDHVKDGDKKICTYSNSNVNNI
ncbi:bidirectional sugar transporter SWEET9 [Carica papaya]|uniref:bidirectional sugar transporter SWEET9 n=1 Tax=Carica papaya TaxID=3649 RepID=UPI000B8CFA27|nr:bidirectional sugar transporter SWEET9 [Carica papaya]